MKEAIAQYKPLAERYFPEDPYTALALIAVESNGNPSARKPNMYSQFWGLMQMGRYAAIDVGFKDNGLDTAKPLHGNAEKAIKSFAAYMKRYAKYHEYDPEAIAVCWKGGPGTCKWVTSQDDWEGEFDAAEEELLEAAADRYGIHRLPEYVKRFRGHYSKMAPEYPPKWEEAQACLLEEE